MHAPVNLFFDVTPLGKVLKIFNSEINRFSEGLYHPLINLPYLICHVLLVVKLMLQLGSFDILILLSVTAWLGYQVALPFLHFENQTAKIGWPLWSSVLSYFYECMRGTSVVRAFGRDDAIVAR